MFQTDANTMEVIGEDTTITDFSTNVAVAGLTITEINDYNTLLQNITTLRVTHTALTILPPGEKFKSLTTLDITNCTNIIQIPTDYGLDDEQTPTVQNLQSLMVAGTKVSSIPSAFTSLTLLDISNCKRISSAGVASLQTLIMSHSSITELVQCTALVRLVALNTKITTIPSAPNLAVILWSGVANATLNMHSDNTAVIQVLTTGEPSSISLAPSATGIVTPILL